MLHTQHLLIGCALVLCACSGGSATAPAPEAGATSAPGATCALTALGGSGVSGSLTFTAKDDGVMVEGSIQGLPPNTSHGFHIHEKGDCSAPDGASAGGHFNPHGANHGGHDATPSHIGDLGNIVADAQGMAKVSVFKKGASIGGGAGDILGRGVIVHEKADDLTTQPTGGAGPRIACGVISAP